MKLIIQLLHNILISLIMKFHYFCNKTLFFDAVEKGSFEIVQTLLSTKNIDVNIPIILFKVVYNILKIYYLIQF